MGVTNALMDICTKYRGRGGEGESQEGLHRERSVKTTLMGEWEFAWQVKKGLAF